MPTKYVPKGVAVPIGSPSTVELPPRIFRGRLTGFLFETDKAFLLPSAMPGVRGLKRFYDEHPGLEVLVSGHADRAGSAGYNLDLSIERAQAIAAFLQDKVDDWTRYYAGTGKSLKWGTREDQLMLSALSDAQGNFYAGAVNGKSDAPTRDAIKRFQTANGLAADGVAGQATRKALIGKYMGLDGTTLPAGTKIEQHGCGEFHPVVSTADGVDEPRNRRVEVFLFEGPIDPAPPGRCPSGGCTQYPRWVAQTIVTVDLTDETGTLDLELVDETGRPLAGERFSVAPTGGPAKEGTLDGQGRAQVDGLPLGQCTITFPDLAAAYAPAA